MGELHLQAQLDSAAPFRQNESLLHCREAAGSWQPPLQKNPPFLCCSSTGQPRFQDFKIQQPLEASLARLQLSPWLCCFQSQGGTGHLSDCHSAQAEGCSAQKGAQNQNAACDLMKLAGSLSFGAGAAAELSAMLAPVTLHGSQSAPNCPAAPQVRHSFRRI